MIRNQHWHRASSVVSEDFQSTISNSNHQFSRSKPSLQLSPHAARPRELLSPAHQTRTSEFQHHGPSAPLPSPPSRTSHRHAPSDLSITPATHNKTPPTTQQPT